MDEIKSLENSKINEPLSPGIRRIILATIILVIFAAYYLYRAFATYEDYEVTATVERADAEQTEYVDFQENLLSYGRDGAFYTDYSGNLLWNATYEMSKPKVKICRERLLIYDKGGTKMIIQSMMGNEGNIATTLPIVDADVSAKGQVAVLMQDGNTGYVQLYASDGTKLASGELHTQNTGYPISIGLSSDGKKLLVSLINLNAGDVKSTLLFYDFGSAGAQKDDNIVGKYSYSNMIIPEVDFVAKDCAIAIGDGEIVVFGNGSTPSVKSEKFFSGQLKSVFHNDNYYGVVKANGEDGGNILEVYNMSGTHRFEKEIGASYTDVEFTKTNEVLLSDGQQVVIYSLLGVKKFDHTFAEGVRQIIPWESRQTYVLIKNDKMERIRLR